MSQSFREIFWDFACSADHRINFLFLTSTTLLLLGLLALPFIDPQSPVFGVLVLDFVLIGSMFLFSVVVMYRCKQRRSKVVDETD